MGNKEKLELGKTSAKGGNILAVFGLLFSLVGALIIACSMLSRPARFAIDVIFPETALIGASPLWYRAVAALLTLIYLAKVLGGLLAGIGVSFSAAGVIKRLVIRKPLGFAGFSLVISVLSVLLLLLSIVAYNIENTLFTGLNFIIFDGYYYYYY